MLEWPENDILDLGSPSPSTTTQVSWLGYRNPMEWKTASGGGLTIVLPKVSMGQIPCQYAWVFKFKNLQNMQA